MHDVIQVNKDYCPLQTAMMHALIKWPQQLFSTLAANAAVKPGSK